MDDEILVPIRSDRDIVDARHQGRSLAASLRFSSTDSTLIATVISELARNIVSYARRGEIRLRAVNGSDRRGLEVVAHDEGPGIPDVAQALRDGFSTSGSLGLGLPGVMRLMDDFHIDSVEGRGTTVTVRKWNPLAPPRLEWGVASLPLAGEQHSGDEHLVAPFPGGALLGAMDGLGHGEAAARAAGAARTILATHRSEPVTSLTQRCHAGLRDTRGVVMTLASIDASVGRMSWLGVGNVQGVLLRAGGKRVEELLLRPGVVGAQLPTLQAEVVPLAPGDTLVFATDGIEPGFDRALARTGRAGAAAETILARHGRATDDALVLVARLLGENG